MCNVRRSSDVHGIGRHPVSSQRNNCNVVWAGSWLQHSCCRLTVSVPKIVCRLHMSCRVMSCHAGPCRDIVVVVQLFYFSIADHIIILTAYDLKTAWPHRRHWSASSFTSKDPFPVVTAPFSIGHSRVVTACFSTQPNTAHAAELEPVWTFYGRLTMFIVIQRHPTDNYIASSRVGWGNSKPALTGDSLYSS